MSLLDKARNPDKDAWYSCPKCPFRTKQRRSLPAVMHNCSKTRSLQTCKEETP